MYFLDRIKSIFVAPKQPTEPKIVSGSKKKVAAVLTSPIPSVVTELRPRPEEEIRRYPQDLAFDIQATSITRFQGETFNPYAYSTFRGLYAYNEPSFYKDYDESYRQNPFTSMVIEYLMHEIFANDFHFEGPGANVTETFFFKDNTREKIKTATREMLKKGNGFMDIALKGQKLVRTRVIDPNSITVDFDSKTGERIYRQSAMGTVKPLNSDYLIHMILKEEVGVPYGISLLRNNIVFLTALMDVGGDIMAALKRVAYAPIIASLDLDWLSDEAEKEKYMAAFRDKLTNVQSSTNNFIIDKKHALSLLGQGAAGARLLPTNDLIEPILSVVLINFGIPLGIFIQTGANKSIITEQRAAMQRFYDDLRNRIKYYVEMKMIPHITGRDTRLVWNKSPITSPEVQDAMKVHILAYQNGLLSAEYIKDQWDIEDNGTTYALPPTKLKQATQGK